MTQGLLHGLLKNRPPKLTEQQMSSLGMPLSHSNDALVRPALNRTTGLDTLLQNSRDRLTHIHMPWSEHQPFALHTADVPCGSRQWSYVRTQEFVIVKRTRSECGATTEPKRHCFRRLSSANWLPYVGWRNLGCHIFAPYSIALARWSFSFVPGEFLSFEQFQL